MPEGLITITEAAQLLGVSPRRVRAYIENGQLPASRVGRQYVISAQALRELQHSLLARAGGPRLSPEAAWRRIAAVANAEEPLLTRASIDAFRRAVRSRADHLEYYVHPALLETVTAAEGVVLGGRSAAVANGVPADVGDVVDVYVRAGDLDDIATRVKARRIEDPSELFNLRVHSVKDDQWPFGRAKSVPPWVAWLDLEDARDRAADTLLDQLVGGRVVS